MGKKKQRANSYQRDYYLANRERLLAYGKAWREGGRQEAKAFRLRLWRAPSEIETLHAKWRARHVKHCEDYRDGTCCPKCHLDPYGLEFVDLPNGDTAYLCCGKRLHNFVGLSETAIYYQMDNRSHGIRTVPKVKHDANEIAKLPEGLLKSWLTEQAKDTP